MENQKSSAEMQIQFKHNANSTGTQIFTQLKRDGNVCIYERRYENQKLFGYEVIISKKILKGTPLPGGKFVEQDYQQYPGPNAFGKHAWFCTTLEKAEYYFQKACAKELEKNSPHAQTKIEYVIPATKFSINEFCTLNNIDNRNTAVNAIKEMVSANKICVYGTEQRNRGRATIIYERV